MYLDSVEETLSYYDSIDDPCDYVKYTPILFNKWCTWARMHKPNSEEQIRPFGQKLGPDWMRTEFVSLDTFYTFYIEITKDI